MAFPNDARKRPAATVSRRKVPESGQSMGARLQAGFVVLVGLSGGLMALFGGGSVLVVGVAMVGGLAVGSGLLWYLRWIVR